MSIAIIGAVAAGLPRRLTVRPSDAHFHEGNKGLSGRISVLLDGVELEEISSYDADRGEVTRHRRDNDGNLLIEQGLPTFETLKGAVEVRWIKGGEPSPDRPNGSSGRAA